MSSAHICKKNNPANDSSQGSAVPRMPHANDDLGHNVQNAYASTDNASVAQPGESANRDFSLKDDGGDIVNGVRDDAQLYAQAMSDEELRDTLESAGRLYQMAQGLSEQEKDLTVWKPQRYAGAFFVPD